LFGYRHAIQLRQPDANPTQNGFINPQYAFQILNHLFPSSLLASWSASLHLALPSPLHPCSYPGCCPRPFLHVPKPAQHRPLVPLPAPRMLDFVRASSSVAKLVLFFSRTDTTCLCSSQTFANDVGQCLLSACTSSSDFQTAEAYFESLCGGAFVRLHLHRAVSERP
jgi:hypothetical protein